MARDCSRVVVCACEAHENEGVSMSWSGHVPGIQVIWVNRNMPAKRQVCAPIMGYISRMTARPPPQGRQGLMLLAGIQEEAGVIAPFPKSYAACCPRCAPFVISPWGAGWGFEAKYL
jgi:hypothetical protein